MNKDIIDIHVDFIDELEIKIPKEKIKEGLKEILADIYKLGNIELYSKYIQTSKIERVEKRMKLKEDIGKIETKVIDNKIYVVSNIKRKEYANLIYSENEIDFNPVNIEVIENKNFMMKQVAKDREELASSGKIVAAFYSIEKDSYLKNKVIFELVIYIPEKNVEEAKKKIYFSK